MSIVLLCYNMFMKKRMIGGGAGIALACVLAAGCSGEAASTPSDPALERIAQQVDLNLGGLALGQKIEFQTPTNEKVTLFNLTKTSVDAKAFESLMTYYGKEAQSLTPRTATIYPTGDPSQPESISILGQSNLYPEHDFIIIPQDASMPKSAEGASAATGYGLSQEISVIQDTPDGDPQSMATGLAVEGCQSMIYYSGGDTVLGSALAQETGCNSFGLAMAEAEAGKPYQGYQLAAKAADLRTVTENSREFPIENIIFSNDEYDQLAATFASSAP